MVSLIMVYKNKSKKTRFRVRLCSDVAISALAFQCPSHAPDVMIIGAPEPIIQKLLNRLIWYQLIHNENPRLFSVVTVSRLVRSFCSLNFCSLQSQCGSIHHAPTSSLHVFVSRSCVNPSDPLELTRGKKKKYSKMLSLQYHHATILSERYKCFSSWTLDSFVSAHRLKQSTHVPVSNGAVLPIKVACGASRLPAASNSPVGCLWASTSCIVSCTA